MGRIARIGVAGFHYVRNIGLDELMVLKEDEDKDAFLKILCKTSRMYQFDLHAFALGQNRFDLLIQTRDDNLPLVMRQINSQYSRYVNNKHKRSGHIWINRYDSWYVSDPKIVQTLYRDIEYQIDAEENKRYTTSHFLLHDVFLSCLKNSFLLKHYSKEHLQQLHHVPFTAKEKHDIEVFKNTQFFLENTHVKQKRAIPLKQFFEEIPTKIVRNERIVEAFYEGYTQSEIARFLSLSQPTVSLVIHNKNKPKKVQKPLKKPRATSLHSKELEKQYEQHFDNIMESLKKYHL